MKKFFENVVLFVKENPVEVVLGVVAVAGITGIIVGVVKNNANEVNEMIQETVEELAA